MNPRNTGGQRLTRESVLVGLDRDANRPPRTLTMKFLNHRNKLKVIYKLKAVRYKNQQRFTSSRKNPSAAAEPQHPAWNDSPTRTFNTPLEALEDHLD